MKNLINSIREIFRQEVRAAQASPRPKEFLTVQETAELIRLSVASVYNLINEGKITLNKRGGKKVIKRDQLLKWLPGNKPEIGIEDDNTFP